MDRNKLPDIDKIFVMNSAGKRIPLANIAHYERSTGPLTIQRENQGRIIHVTGGVVPGTDIQSAEMEIRALITREIPADENLVIEFSGDYANIIKFGNRLIILFIISILLVYGIMASLFENFLDPFIIMFTLPLTVTGVVVIHILTNLNFSMFTLIGLITLAGVVVNNGIVLVDYTNLMRKRGMKLFDAIPYAGGHRLRPVLMTSLTTILALVPLAFDKGEGIDLIRPIGITILGGLSVSTLFTLFLIPLIYSYFMQFADRLHIKRAAKWQKKMEARREILTHALAAEHMQHDEVKDGSA
jgi:hydrophobic/amphiphilic exporter-1 (mainly G- bacteria), HAE1 family